MRILCVTSVRNEAPFLLEWIAHLRGAGVTDFLVYSNDCNDGTDVLLDRLAAEGVLAHVPQTLSAEDSPQWTALRAAWRHPLRKACDWALVADVDEFINIHTADHTIPALLGALPPETDAIALAWRLFGNAGRVTIDAQPTTEQFTRAMPENCVYPIAATLFKTLFRLEGPFNGFGVHRPRQKAPEKAGLPNWVDGAGAPLDPRLAQRAGRLSLYGLNAGRTLAEMNHYSLRSAASFLVKRDRGLPNRSHKALDLAYWVERNFNTETNQSIAPMRPATQRAEAELRALPEVAQLHDAGLDWHRQRFDTLMRDEAAYTLFSQILVAGDSAVLPPQTAQRLVRMYQTFASGR